MILVDTSIWVDHLRRGTGGLAQLLQEGLVATHRLVIQELACGRLAHRTEILDLLETLPKLPETGHSEFLEFVHQHALEGKGLGAVDVHLLASARLGRARIWSRDRMLCRAAGQLEILASP